MWNCIMWRERKSRMASSKEYLDFILEQLSELEDVSYRAMMGEYIIYYQDKIVGGIYDDRFLVKPTKSALVKMPEAAGFMEEAGMPAIQSSLIMSVSVFANRVM